MITKDLHDEDTVEEIRKFVRITPDIEVYEYLRRGLNGDVYFGKRTKMGDEVVLKFYWSHPNYDATEEAVILQSINHDNILKIYDLRFLPPNFAFFLTPKISGGDLQGIIDHKKFSTKESLEIISGILIGLTDLHATHKLVHRDLKPGNILLNISNNQPIIADLGAVKKNSKADGFVTASKSTYLYLPPEAINCNKYYFQSDIYQVGIIMFQLLGGYFPVHDPMKWLTPDEQKEVNATSDNWEQNSKYEEHLGKKIVNGKIINIATLPEYLDNRFKKVLNKALHANYESRYKNTALFLREIHQLLRIYPDYIEDKDKLIIRHRDGKSYQLYKNNRQEIILEKQIANNKWRKDHGHNGTYKSALLFASKSS